MEHDRAALYCRLSEMPCHLHKAEMAALLADGAVCGAREALQIEEDRLLLAGSIDGKNEAARAAQLRMATAPARAFLADKERQAAVARMELRCIQAEFSATKAMARLLAGGEA